MTRNIIMLSRLIAFLGMSVISISIFAQNNCTCAICGRPCNDIAKYGHVKGYSCDKASAGSAAGSSAGSSEDLSYMIAGAIMQNVLSSILGKNSAKNQKEPDAKQRADELAAREAAMKKAEEQRISAAIAQAEYERMMKSYKLLDSTQNLKIKTLKSTNLDFKTLDSDSEDLSFNARKQFENTSLPPVPAGESAANPTPFFGDTMPVEDLQTLINPENNPAIVDLKAATGYVDDNIKKDSLKIVSLLRENETGDKGEPIIQKPDCIVLKRQVKEFTNQRQQFQKTIDLAWSEVDVWETANRNALMNAAKDGLEYFTGQWLDQLSNRAKAAERLQKIYDLNVKQMIKDGIDVAELRSRIDALRTISSAGKIADLTTSMNDWKTFVKDGMSSLIATLNVSNSQVESIFADPELKKYFEAEKPELNALLDISKLAASNMVFGKWVARKIPLIACVELSIKQTYNGLDYFLSLNRIIEARQIYGGALEAARHLQQNIDDSCLALGPCK